MAEKSRKRAVYRVVPAKEKSPKERWELEHKEGRQTVKEPFPTQSEAIAAGRVQAKEREPSQIVVHGRDGRIRTEYTYGADPRRYRG